MRCNGAIVTVPTADNMPTEMKRVIDVKKTSRPRWRD